MTGLLLLLGLSTIIYDNYQDDQDLETDWGFACLVEYQGNKLLFDAGRKAELYKTNVKQLDIHPEEIPTLFISHEHGDHTAGMSWIIEMNPSVMCYLPASYAGQLKASGNLPSKSRGIEIHTLIGGLHLMNKNAEELEQLATSLKEMGIKRICPTHCTGDKSIDYLQSSFGDGYISGGTGKEIIIQ